MERIVWLDGARWSAEQDLFDALRRQLDALRDHVIGLDAVLDRWALHVGPVVIDVIAASEADRAVLTAAVRRAHDEATHHSMVALGLEDSSRDGYLKAVSELSELIRTDVTW